MSDTNPDIDTATIFTTEVQLEQTEETIEEPVRPQGE